MTNEEITANSVMMITGGYETTANALTFLAYNLATHKDAQARVYREVQTAITKYVSMLLFNHEYKISL